MASRSVVIGVDGGGTYTRALCADLTGRPLACVEGGGCNPSHNEDGGSNVREAIRAAIVEAGRAPGDVVGLVAGMAGFDEPKDEEWAARYTAVEGLECPRLHVNDAVVAHAGALRSRPGVIAISGTGSIIFGVTETGRHIRNYDFLHYAHTAARYLSFDLVYRLLAGDVQPEDAAFVTQILDYWQVETLAELREKAMRNVQEPYNELKRLYGGMAPLVTQAASRGVPLARAACDTAIETLSVGIRLVGGCFALERVPVALIGGVAGSPYIRAGLTAALPAQSANRFHVVEPMLSSVAGAALMALERHGIAPTDPVVEALRTAG